MNSEAPNPSPKPQRRFRYVPFAGIVLCLFVFAMIFIQWWKPWLNESERRMLGVWTWQDEPGDLIFHYRNDGTMRYQFDDLKGRVKFARWSIEGNKYIVEHSPQDQLRYIYLKQFYLRLKRNQGFGNEYATIDFCSDGTISFMAENGKTKVLIPWSSEQGELLKTAR